VYGLREQAPNTFGSYPRSHERLEPQSNDACSTSVIKLRTCAGGIRTLGTHFGERIDLRHPPIGLALCARSIYAPHLRVPSARKAV
jgi:hypothetical protein